MLFGKWVGIVLFKVCGIERAGYVEVREIEWEVGEEVDNWQNTSGVREIIPTYQVCISLIILML